MSKHTIYSTIILLFLTTSSFAQADATTQSCEQIKAEIKAHTGEPSSPNVDLLKKLSGRNECEFTASEAYRAAYGDKVIPIENNVHQHSEHTRHSKHDSSDDE